MMTLKYGLRDPETNELTTSITVQLDYPEWSYDGRVTHRTRRRVYTGKTFGRPVTNFQGYDAETTRIPLIYRHDRRPVPAVWPWPVGQTRMPKSS